jgi:uncharacterized protein (TIGR02996 family)
MKPVTRSGIGHCPSGEPEAGAVCPRETDSKRSLCETPVGNTENLSESLTSGKQPSFPAHQLVDPTPEPCIRCIDSTGPMPMYHPEELALLAAVHASPKDDLPRLVYADWLDEHGRPELAEFIRLQVARAAEMESWSAGTLTAREKALVRKHGVQWRGQRMRPGGVLDGQLHFTGFHRGLPDADYYSSNHSFRHDSMARALEAVRPNYQVRVVLNIYRDSEDEPEPYLRHPLVARAQRVHVRALGRCPRTGQYPAEVPLRHEHVVEAVKILTGRRLLVAEFGAMTAESLALVKAELSTHTPTLTPAFPCSE